MSLLFRALKKAEDKDKNPDEDSSPQLMDAAADDKPGRGSSRKTLLGVLLVLSVAAIGGLLYLPEIEDLLVPRVVAVAPAGPTAEQRAAEAQRLAEEDRLAEEQRLIKEARLAEEERLVEEKLLAEEARLADEQRKAEQAAQAQRVAEAAAQQQAEVAARLAEEQRRLDEIGVAASAELTLITDALEAARREREALDLAQRLASEQNALNAAAARDLGVAAKATLAALRDEIASQRAVLAALTAPSPAPAPEVEAPKQEAIQQPAPQATPQAVPTPPRPGPDGEVDVAALVTYQGGEPAVFAPSGPIIIERTSAVEEGALAGLITVTDESDYFTDRYDAARRSLNAGGARSALSIYDELLVRQPRDRTALLGRATALHQLGRSGEAITAYETVLRHHPDELTALTNLLGLVGQQTPESALKQLRRLYASNPSFGAVAAQMAMIYLNLGDSANAIRLMIEAAALALDNPVYQINLAIMHDRAGDASSAADAYEYALLVAVGSAEVLPLSLDAIRERLRYLRAN